jgi:predicted transcriptional regulator
MEKEFKTEELKAVWEALSKAYGENEAGCKAADIAAATGLAEEVVRACLEYLKQTGKVERAGELYVPTSKAGGPKAAVEMTSRRYGTRSPVAVPEREMRFSRQGASNISEADKEAVYRALVAAYREKGHPVMVGEVADKARGVGSMQRIGQILRALEEDNRAERSRSKEGGGVEVWEPK